MTKTFANWRKTFTTLVRMEDKKEWDDMDWLSRWFIATRTAVSRITLYSGFIGGLYAWQYMHSQGQPFNYLMWIVLILGLFLAHGTNNLINDFTDFSRGIDKDNYFRTQYGVHPLAQGFWDKKTHLIVFAVTGALALLCGLSALVYTHFSPVVIGLILFGSLILLFYTYPLKYFALGEISIFLIWGPMMIGGVYFVLTGLWSWTVILASIPIGATVVTINLGKHTDKRLEDKAKKVTTLPVLVGETAARYITMTAIVAAYVITIYLAFITRFFTPIMLLIFLAYKPAIAALQRLSKPRPTEPPPGYPIWPRWFSTVCFVHNIAFSNYFVIGLILDTLIKLVLPKFW
jgi:1,4-dihydroxy-2-naphthoate polyprenyltransferase